MLEKPMMWYKVPSSDLQIMQNGSGELFVQCKVDRSLTTKIRITPSYNGLHITSGNGGGRLEPWSVNGLPAFVVIPE